MLELSNENLSTAKASNSLTTKAKSLVACGRLKPNSVKIDVEGAEIEVLRGMSHTIRQFKPTIIYEVDDETKEALLAKKREIEWFLENLNYKITLLDKSYSQTTWNVENSIAIPA